MEKKHLKIVNCVIMGKKRLRVDQNLGMALPSEARMTPLSNAIPPKDNINLKSAENLGQNL